MEDDLARIPCMFTLNLPVPIFNDRKTELKRNLEEELTSLKKRTDKEDIEEMIQSMDLLTWVEFKLGNSEKALELNDKVMHISQERRKFTLANRAHLYFYRGDLPGAREILDEIDRLPRTAMSEATIKAQQAYCFFRLGGPDNLEEAIKLYEQALEQYSGIYLWFLQLGVVYRRASHPNMIRVKDNQDQVKARRTFYKPRAAELFDHVITNSSTRRVKAIAYSEKCFMASTQRADRDQIELLCRNALDLVKQDDDPFVLTLCGKALLKVNKLWARELLERATKASQSSHAFDTLGRCWKNIAKDKKLSGGRSFYEQTEFCFREAVRLSPENGPAKLSWAKLLQENGLVKEAFEKYKDIIVSVGSNDNLFTLASAYELAAVCLVTDYNELEVKHTPRGISLISEAEQMCIKALALEFKVLPKRELRGTTALKCLREIADSRKNPETSDRISRLLGLVDNPEIDFQLLRMLVKAIDTMHMIDARVTIKTYHQRGSHEAAYALLEVSTVWYGNCVVNEDIALDVALDVAKARLMQTSLEAMNVFSDLFRKDWQTQNLLTVRYSDVGSRPLIRPSENAAKSEIGSLDVLIVCDETNGEISSVWQLLQKAIRDVYGLTVSLNQRHRATAIASKQLQLEEMRKAKVVLVLFGPRAEGSFFDTVLQGIPSIVVRGENNQRPPHIVVGKINASAEVPACLSGFPQMSLDIVTEAFSYFESLMANHSAEDFTAVDDRGAHIGTIISFFCFLAGIRRPSTADEKA